LKRTFLFIFVAFLTYLLVGTRVHAIQVSPAFFTQEIFVSELKTLELILDTGEFIYDISDSFYDLSKSEKIALFLEFVKFEKLNKKLLILVSPHDKRHSGFFEIYLHVSPNFNDATLQSKEENLALREKIVIPLFLNIHYSKDIYPNGLEIGGVLIEGDIFESQKSLSVLFRNKSDFFVLPRGTFSMTKFLGIGPESFNLPINQSQNIVKPNSERTTTDLMNSKELTIGIYDIDLVVASGKDNSITQYGTKKIIVFIPYQAIVFILFGLGLLTIFFKKIVGLFNFK